jgi:hypothetical protein
MAKLADAADSKSAEVHPSWGFNSPSRHQAIPTERKDLDRKAGGTSPAPHMSKDRDCVLTVLKLSNYRIPAMVYLTQPRKTGPPKM